MTVSAGLLPGHNALSSWEMPAHCILDEVEFLKNGRFGATCKGQLKRDGAASAVIIKMFKGIWSNIIAYKKMFLFAKEIKKA